MHITPERVRDIVIHNDGNQDAQIAEIAEIQRTSVSQWKFYHIVLSDDPDRAYLLLVAPHPPTPGLMALSTLSTLLIRILDTTTIPLPRPIAHADDIDVAWLLLQLPTVHPPPTASLAAMRAQLTPTELARVYRRLGTHLRALHGVTHEVFGAPGDAPTPDPASSFAALLAAGEAGEGEGEGEGDEAMIPYSWQDTFVLRLEALVDRVCAGGRVELDVSALRSALCRAIGSFLFEDVEMPRLIWVTGNEEDVVVSGDEVAYLLPTFGHALWGDPLMETWFMPPGPDAAMHEGYFEGEADGTLIVFARQKTKQTWYSVYLALLVLAEDGESEWAKKRVEECIEILKDARCY